MLPQRLPLDQMAVAWAQQLDPVIDNQLLQGSILTNIKLSAGATSINHKLSRKLVGYIIIGKDAPANVYDSQAKNTTPALTLTLNSDIPCVISLVVF